MTDVTLEGLRVCREIALLGSFSAAARSLGYSQPAISRQVGAMEDAVGQRLFVREARGVSVTAAGAVMLEHAAHILGGVHTLERSLESLADRLTGRVAVGAFPAAMSVLVPRAVAHLDTEHPGLRVSLVEAATPALLRDLRSGRLDVVVVGVGSGLADYDLSDLSVHRLYAGDLCVAVPEDHRLATSAEVDVAQLTDEHWIAGAGSAAEPQFAAWPTLADPVIRFRLRSWPARFGMVAAGLGICLLPELAARSVPAGVTVIGVKDPDWTGRATLAVTRIEPAHSVSAVIQALRSSVDQLAPG
ncbi:LysR family transcriptional regulator [Mycobacterium sp. MS1601]|uniref:LysR family transcriptional regulator n=1 Tax=Mycobacterium sp. MS1601 TaxID=1936029 RepID=UPI0009797BCB|nr:LysR family transcriptional regulator [Mycobacterium sp. MS1601]AQA06769.1 LysR family transcriptional regulator [Mycobacterium sp. MS1601]